MHTVTFKRGFTLIETMIYVGLFGVLMTGVVLASIPVMSGAERMNARVMEENEIALVSRTILSLIPQARIIHSPIAGAEGGTLTLTTYSPGGPEITYAFFAEGGAIMARVSVGGAPLPAQPLTLSRVRFEQLSVRHIGGGADTPSSIELMFDANGVSYGPYRSYLSL